MPWILIIVILISAVLLAVQIWGIVAAATTKDVELSVAKLLLHIFFWGGLIAGIVYAIKSDSNKKSYLVVPNQQLTSVKDNKTTSQKGKVATDEKLSKIDKLLEDNKITKEEHAELRRRILEEI